jgi:hypothetical protein
MLKVKKNIRYGKCKECGDRQECRLCSIVIGEIRGSKIVSCNSKEKHKEKMAAIYLGRASVLANNILDQQELFK